MVDGTCGHLIGHLAPKATLGNRVRRADRSEYAVSSRRLLLVTEDQGVSGTLAAVGQSVEIPCAVWDFDACRRLLPCNGFHRFADHARTRRGPRPVSAGRSFRQTLARGLIRWPPIEPEVAVRRLPSLAGTKDAPPARHSGAETFAFGLRDAQVGGHEPRERRQSLEEGGRIETRVLLGRQHQQRLKLELRVSSAGSRKSRASARSRSARTLLAASSRRASVGP
jgi:hypothetical protein